MPLSWNEIRDRALAFSREWKDAESERADAQTFWNEFFLVFGIERKRVAIFEKQVKLSRAGEKIRNGRIDAFWKGVLLVEHKSAGQDLERAFAQAADYFEGLAERDLPRYILVSDFRHFRLFDLESGADWKIALADLHKHVRRFGFVAGYRTQEIREQDPVNVEAAERMGRLHDHLMASGYAGHPLEVLLVRLLFCLFADDTGIFPKQSFREYVETRTGEDGSDLGMHLAQLFQVLNTDYPQRQNTLDEALAAFPYVNGRLFEEALPLAAFDARMRSTLLDCTALDWSRISPAVFGALFQSVMDERARRNLGAHYTSEKNILKLIGPLFLDDLRAEFERVKSNLNRLFEFHKRLRTLTFLDPACGCGNFLVIAYREIRLLELDILRAVLKMERGQQHLNVFQLVQVNVDQFHGIEIEEFPAQIAQVAMWLIDHQMNQLVSEEFGHYYARLPLTTSPHIVNANALRLDWSEVIPKERISFVFGNPPFVGKQHQTSSQKSDMALVCSAVDGAGVLDFVAAWYIKAAAFTSGTSVRTAFVSTNSIAQGEQVAILWGHLIARGATIFFAHRTFQWTNEARGVAAVHCVVIGFAFVDVPAKTIFEYDNPRGEPHAISASNISPYLVDAPNVIVASSRVPIFSCPEIVFGNMPNDGGHLLLSDADRATLLRNEPSAESYLRQFVSADEFLDGRTRWCLWLRGAEPADLRRLPDVWARIEAVREHRLHSSRDATRRLAAFPTLFGEIRQPAGSYILIPRHSSERRTYIPFGFFGPEVIVADSCLAVIEADLYHFGVLQSLIHMAWVRTVCGRIKSDYRYTNQVVYNNFPWPSAVSDSVRTEISECAQGVLASRAGYPRSSLADLYDPLGMPPDLVRAHHALDRVVDAAYTSESRRRPFATDAERIAFLFELYQRQTSLLPAGEPSTPGRRARQRRRT